MNATLRSIRISVRHGSSARHFWESALGLHAVEDIEITDPARREAWGVTGAAPLRMTQLELGHDVFPKVELVEWEECGQKPIRNSQHPWDYGLLALRIPCSDLPGRLAQVSHWRCPVTRRSDGAAVVTSPAGEQILLTEGGDLAAVAVVPSLAAAAAIFCGTLGMANGVPVRTESGFPGAATVENVYRQRFAGLEVIEFQRSADPRPALNTGTRLHPRRTGYCMLSVSASGLRPGVVRGPAGIPIEVV